MMSSYNWSDDGPAAYKIELKYIDSTTGDEVKESVHVINAYSQWKFRSDLGFWHDKANQGRLEQWDETFVIGDISDLTISAGPSKLVLPQVIKVDTKLFFSNNSFERLAESTPSKGDDSFFRRVLLPLPLRGASVAVRVAPPEDSWYEPNCEIDPEKVVIVGIIDDAINIMHDNFCDKNNKTRIDFSWVQDAPTTAPKVDSTPSFVSYGREWRAQDLDGARATYGNNEEAAWKSLDLITDGIDYRQSALRFRGAHGTHIADLAAGHEKSDAGTENQRIITVQLPILTTQDTSGTALITVVRDAALYIYQRAVLMSKKLGKPVPVVLNISYGIANGSRQGQQLLERALQKLAHKYRQDVSHLIDDNGNKMPKPAAITVLPVGNGHLARGHAQSFSDGRGVIDLKYRLQPQDETCSYLEIWYPSNTDKIKFSIAMPNTEAKDLEFSVLSARDIGSAKNRKAQILKDDTNTNSMAISRVTIDEPALSPDGLRGSLHWRVLFSFAPTSSAPNLAVAPHGEWKIKSEAFAGGLPISNPIHAWIPRDEPLAGFPRLARQAYFEDSVHDNCLFDFIGDISVEETPADCMIKRDITMSGLASSQATVSPETKPVIVAANYWNNHHATAYSAAGSKADNFLPVDPPVISAPCDTSRDLQGILASGNRTGSTLVQNGTSVGVPQVVRWLVDELSNLPTDGRANFAASDFIFNKLGTTDNSPPRPDNDHREVRTKPEIRYERLKGGFLPVHEDHEKNINRNVLRKI